MSAIRDSIIHAVHFNGENHDTENFRGCTHPDCKELRDLFRFVNKPTELAEVESVATWHSGGGIWLDLVTLGNGQLLVVSDELVSIWRDLDEFMENTGDKHNSLSRITTEVVFPYMKDECEHTWRVSPYDAGLTFCCLCGIEYDPQEQY